MGNHKEYPVRFAAKGLCDAYDSTETFAGACTSLQNLIFDPANPELVICRPGVGSTLAAIAASGFISCHIAIGNYIYGMVTSPTLTGHDEPFCWKIGTGAIVITGGVLGNTPLSPSATGDWVPPTMAVIGVSIIVTHPGFPGGATVIGIIDITNPAAPTWTGGNTATHQLPSVPVSVVNFNNRAWYACGNMYYYSDVLVPATMTNAGQSLTIGDSTPIIVSTGLPVQTSSSGVISSLIAFKEFQMWQITGDAATSSNPLTVNFISLTVGTRSPRSVVQTPVGTIFIGVDGPNVLLSTGAVVPLTKEVGKLDQDVQAPFQNMLYPSRAAAAFSGSVYRVCIVPQAGAPSDYWFDITRRRWNGPHTFAYDCASQVGNYFVLSGYGSAANIFKSIFSPNPSGQVSYNDNGAPITVVLKSSQLPKTPNINEKQVIESTIEMSAQNNTSIQISAFNEDNDLLDIQTIISGGSLAGIWGVSVWGQFMWGSAVSAPATFTVPWSQPLVFKKLSIEITALSNNYLSIGSFFAKYRDTGYINR